LAPPKKKVGMAPARCFERSTAASLFGFVGDNFSIFVMPIVVVRPLPTKAKPQFKEFSNLNFYLV
jgi:hypothetical protein